jgi:HK97 gp10 family phage protein
MARITLMGFGAVKITGLKELQARANRLDKRLRRKVYNEAARAGGKVIVAAAKAKVPVRTGAVKSSLVHRASSSPNLGYFGVKVSVKGGKKSSSRIAHRRGGKGKRSKGGSEYFPDAVERYYRFTELGTKYHPAKPYLSPSLEGSRAQILNVVKTTLAAGIEREARSL